MRVKMKEEIILKILQKSMKFIPVEQVRELRGVLEETLYGYDITPQSTALVPLTGIPEKVEMYLSSKELDGLSPNTIKNYRMHLFRFAAFVQKDVDQINVNDVRMYLYLYSKRGIKNSSLGTITSYLKSFFQWLENEEYIVKSPMRKIKQAKVEKRVRKALTSDELEMLRVACRKPREHALVELFYSTGCRLDEIQKLNRSDIDWNNKAVMVIGKGNKERQVFLNSKAYIHLKNYLNSRDDSNEALFVGERQPHDRLGRRAIEKVFSDLGIRARITKRVYPHLLRHTTATTMLNNGASLAEVQGLLGHNSPSTTQIYAVLNTEAIRQSHLKNVS
jgi:integrase/recombinase XerD